MISCGLHLKIWFNKFVGFLYEYPKINNDGKFPVNSSNFACFIRQLRSLGHSKFTDLSLLHANTVSLLRWFSFNERCFNPCIVSNVSSCKFGVFEITIEMRLADIDLSSNCEICEKSISNCCIELILLSMNDCIGLFVLILTISYLLRNSNSFSFGHFSSADWLCKIICSSELDSNINWSSWYGGRIQMHNFRKVFQILTCLINFFH